MKNSIRPVQPADPEPHDGSASMTTSFGRIGEDSRAHVTVCQSVTAFVNLYGKWCRGEITQARAASLLGKSERTFRRYVSRYEAMGVKGLEDRRARPSHRRASDRERGALLRLYADECPGGTVLRFFRQYTTKHGGKRSYAWVKNCLQQAGLVSKSPGRTTQHEPQPRAAAEGELIHYCVERYSWVPPLQSDLCVTFDDATNRIHSASSLRHITSGPTSR